MLLQYQKSCSENEVSHSRIKASWYLGSDRENEEQSGVTVAMLATKKISIIIYFLRRWRMLLTLPEPVAQSRYQKPSPKTKIS
jgi:hypothetical protein